MQMAFEWKQYLELAKFLDASEVPECISEATARCAVSRAYYAAFCHARNFARDNLDFVPSGYGDDHSGVRRHYKNKGKLHIYTKLGHLNVWRGQCDYNDKVSNLDKLLSSAIKQAEDIINGLHL